MTELEYTVEMKKILVTSHLSFPTNHLTYYQTTNFRLTQIEKTLQMTILKFEENGRNFFKPEENTVGKGEIAHYEQFLLFPQCFQKACFPGASKGVTVWEWANSTSQSKNLTTLQTF